jgi:hydrogenase-4 membrane subunit HyfE
MLVLFYPIIIRSGLNIWLLPGLPPDWWLTSAEKMIRHVTWIHINTGIGLLIVSIPVALGIVLLDRKKAILLASVVAISCLLLHPLLFTAISSWNDYLGWQRFTVAADYLKQLLFLPLLTALFVVAFRRWIRGRRS